MFGKSKKERRPLKEANEELFLEVLIEAPLDLAAERRLVRTSPTARQHNEADRHYDGYVAGSLLSAHHNPNRGTAEVKSNQVFHLIVIQ